MGEEQNNAEGLVLVGRTRRICVAKHFSASLSLKILLIRSIILVPLNINLGHS